MYTVVRISINIESLTAVILLLYRSFLLIFTQSDFSIIVVLCRISGLFENGLDHCGHTHSCRRVLSADHGRTTAQVDTGV